MTLSKLFRELNAHEIYNADVIIERVRLAARSASVHRQACGDNIEFIDPDAATTQQRIANLTSQAVNDFWLEVEMATPASIPEDIEGHASDGQVYDVFVAGDSSKPKLALRVDIFERLT